ncbi:MAG: hypothetical protein AAF573_18615 [Bacteroidota bacterium]
MNKNGNRPPHPHRIKVNKYLVENDLVKVYAELLGMNKKDLIEFLKYPSRLKKKDFAALYGLLGVLPTDLGIDDVHLDISKNKSLEPQNKFFCFSIWKRDNLAEEEFIEKYFDAIITTLKKAEKKILINDFLINTSNMLSGKLKKKFFKGYENYYRALEAQTKNLKYQRVISLPIELSKTTLGTENNRIKLLEKLISILFKSTFKHIITSFENAQFELYALPIPKRNFSFLLIDDQYVLSEYYRIRREGLAVPDMLFIEKVDKERKNIPEKLHYVYNRELEDSIDNKRAIKISKELFAECTRNSLKQKEKEIRENENIPNKNAIQIQNLESLKEERKEIAEKVNILEQNGL